MEKKISTSIEHRRGKYLISDDPARLDPVAVHAYLSRSYWAENMPLPTLERALHGSLCIGAYDANLAQIGLARFISDFSTFCYVCDVYVLEEHRRNGLAHAMMAMAVHHPKLQGLRRWNLVTQDAHRLYSEFGFVSVKHPERYMERLDTDVYKRLAESADE
jgi:GNAT superfamily N-acetyltransferase